MPNNITTKRNASIDFAVPKIKNVPSAKPIIIIIGNAKFNKIFGLNPGYAGVSVNSLLINGFAPSLKSLPSLIALSC